MRICLKQCVSKCGLWTSCISTTCQWLEMQIIGPIQTQETPEMGPSKPPQVIMMHANV